MSGFGSGGGPGYVGQPIAFNTEEEARAFARTQPPGVIGVVPSTVTEPGSAKWQQRETALADARARKQAQKAMQRRRRLDVAGAVSQFVAILWMLICVTATAWFAWHTWAAMAPAVGLTNYHALPVVAVPVSVPGPGCTSAEASP